MPNMVCSFRNAVIWNAVSVFATSTLASERAGIASRTRVVEAHQEEELEDFTVVNLINHGPSHVHRSLIEEGFTENLVSDAYHDALSEHQSRTLRQTGHRSVSIGDPGDIAEPAGLIPTLNIQNSQYMGHIQVGEGVPAMSGNPAIPPAYGQAALSVIQGRANTCARTTLLNIPLCTIPRSPSQAIQRGEIFTQISRKKASTARTCRKQRCHLSKEKGCSSRTTCILSS